MICGVVTFVPAESPAGGTTTNKGQGIDKDRLVLGLSELEVQKAKDFIWEHLRTT